MENDSAFLPSGQTYAITGAVTPPTPVQVGGPTTGSPVTAKIYNSGTVLVGVSFAATAAQATTNAALPTTGSPTQVLILAPGEDGTFTVPPGQWWTVVTPSSTAVVYIQTGYGV